MKSVTPRRRDRSTIARETSRETVKPRRPPRRDGTGGRGRSVGNRGGRFVDGNLGELRLAMIDSLSPVKMTV